jgi:hypothetical protein
MNSVNDVTAWQGHDFNFYIGSRSYLNRLQFTLQTRVGHPTMRAA